MYEEYFGLERRPFAATPDVSCAYLPGSVQEVLNELLLRVEAGQGIALLTAPAGTGKTFLCRRLSAELSERFAPIFIGSSNFPTRRALFQAILYELGANYSGLDEQELRLELQSQFKKMAQAGQALLLILDEAHLLSTRLLEEVRSLADLSECGQPLVRVLVSGQPALEERLISPELDAFNQRLACHVFLEQFTRVQAREYAEHRIRWAGGNPDALFTAEALDVIAQGSNGIPRCINQLCDHSLLLTFVAEEAQVTRQIVEDALSDLKQLPLHWNDVLPASSPLDSLQQTGDSEVESPTEDAAALTQPTTTEATRPVSEEFFAFEVGAEPDEYQLVESAKSPVASAEIPVEDSTVTSLSAKESAPCEKDQTLIGMPETPSIPFRPVLSQFSPEPRQSNLAAVDQEERGWEPVVEETDLHETVEIQRKPVRNRPADSARRGVVPLADLPLGSFAGFQEETIVDRYAAIDAGVPGKAGNSMTTPQFNPAYGMSRGGSDLPRIPDAPGAIAVPSLPPDQMIDQIMPLLNAAVDGSVDISNPAFDSLPADSEPEETVGSEVLDLCLEVQDFFTQDIARQEPTAQPQSEQTHDNEEFESSESEDPFDVIEPEQEREDTTFANRFHVDPQHTADDRGGAAPSGPRVPRPNYRRIFSLLRRKLGR